MIRFSIKVCLLSPILGANCLAAEPDSSEQYVVMRTESVQRLPESETGNLSPRKERDSKAGEIWISNSCGFAEYSYHAVKLEEYSGYFNTAYSVEELPMVKARGHLGERCRLEPFLYEIPTVVTIEYWDGKAYVSRDAPIHWDSGDQEYIDDPRIIEENGWTDKLVEILDPTNSSNCFVKDGITESRFEYLRGRESVQEYGDKYCFSKGVYVRELSNNWKEADFIKSIE